MPGVSDNARDALCDLAPFSADWHAGIEKYCGDSYFQAFSTIC